MMEENILEVNFLGFFPDMVVVRRLDGEGTDARRYVPQDLYEDVDAANMAWQEENRKMRELLAETFMPYRDYAKKYGIAPYLADVNEHLDARLRKLGIEVDA